MREASKQMNVGCEVRGKKEDFDRKKSRVGLVDLVMSTVQADENSPKPIVLCRNCDINDSLIDISLIFHRLASRFALCSISSLSFPSLFP